MRIEVEQSGIKNSTWWKRHTIMMRYLKVLTIITIIIGLSSLMIAVYRRNLHTRNIQSNNETVMNGENEKNVCHSFACNLTASRVLEYMDETKNPCDNFYEFTCGNFVKKTNIPDDHSAMTSFNILSDLLRENLRTIMEQPIETYESSPFQLIKNLYNSCMNIKRIEENGLKSIDKILKKLGGWPLLDGASWAEGSFNWMNSVYSLKKLGFSVSYFVDFSIYTDSKNSTKTTIYLDQAYLGLSRQLLIKGLEDKIVKAYYNYMIDIACLFGANRERAETELKESLKFELELAKISLPEEQRRDDRVLYNPMTIGQLEEKFPTIPWTDYINNILTPESQVTRDEVVIVKVTSYIKDFEALINKTPKRVQANYMIWRVVTASVFYLTEPLRNTQLDYYANITGTTKRKPRWEECVSISAYSLSIASGAIYVRKYFNEHAKQKVKEMVDDIRSEFYEILKQVDWMDEITRKNALEKAESMATYIAYPDELLDNAELEEYYSGLKLDPDDYLLSILKIRLFRRSSIYKSWRLPVNRTDWRSHSDSAVANAFYSPSENSITFPAGILQGIFFDADRPRYMNYGAIGSIIGHEITHGFDDKGRQFDKNGNLVEWWQEQTKSAFLEKAQCIIDQYGNYTVPELGIKVNGINTQGENIADNGGMKEAYLAYIKWVERNGIEPKLPHLNYTPQQMFWISTANVWCSKYRPEYLKLNILTDDHSPNEFRVLGPMSNSEYFAKDFNCHKGSPMNPLKSCQVW